jgi:hypothetical protein
MYHRAILYFYFESWFFLGRSSWTVRFSRFLWIDWLSISKAILAIWTIWRILVMFHHCSLHQGHLLYWIRHFRLSFSLLFNIDCYSLFFWLFLFAKRTSWSIWSSRKWWLRWWRLIAFLRLAIIIKIHVSLRFWFLLLFLVRKWK